MHKSCLMIFQKKVVSWTAIICGYIESGHYKEGIDLFRGLLEIVLLFLFMFYMHVQTIGDIVNGQWIDRYMSESGLNRNVFVTTSLVDIYIYANWKMFKCGSCTSCL